MDNHPEHPIVHDGIFLGYDKNIPLKNEGLGRLLAFVVSGWIQLPSHRLTIACPHWLVKDLQSLLQEHGISQDRYDLLCTKEPWWRKLQGRLKSFERAIRPTVHRYRALIRGEMLTASTAIPVGVLVAVVLWWMRFLWPAILVLPTAIASYWLWRRYRKRSGSSQQVDPKRLIRKQKRGQKRYARQMAQLIKHINQQQKVQHWLVPTPFWPEANRITHAKAIVCPDLVLQQFPLRFADPSTEPIYSRILDTLEHSEQLICYSEFIRSHQLIDGVGLAPEQIQVIGHGRVELCEFLKLGKSMPDHQEQQQIALEFLRTYQRSCLASNPYWRRYEWNRGSYVFYSSQARGQKNILSLLRAIEILRSRTNEPVRLVLTCQRFPNSDIDLFVSEHRLEPWVLFANDVSNQVLASLYCWSSLAVNPTLFEGGFPFTFTEAYSVGTPSILSDIPMVRERIQDTSLPERMLFDPMNPQDLAEKIRWAIKHRAELFHQEKTLFDAFPSWQTVASLYSDSLRRPRHSS